MSSKTWTLTVICLLSPWWLSPRQVSHLPVYQSSCLCTCVALASTFMYVRHASASGRGSRGPHHSPCVLVLSCSWPCLSHTGVVTQYYVVYAKLWLLAHVCSHLQFVDMISLIDIEAELTARDCSIMHHGMLTKKVDCVDRQSSLIILVKLSECDHSSSFHVLASGMSDLNLPSNLEQVQKYNATVEGLYRL